MFIMWFILGVIFCVCSVVEYFTERRLNIQLLLLCLGWIAFVLAKLYEK